MLKFLSAATIEKITAVQAQIQNHFDVNACIASREIDTSIPDKCIAISVQKFFLNGVLLRPRIRPKKANQL